MSAIDILLNGKIITAILVFIIFSIIVEITARKILHMLDDVSVTEWIFEKVFIPLSRAIGLMIFILLSYPVLFGVTDAPPLSELISAGGHRISSLINILFVLPLAFSVIPVFGGIPALLLPVQGIAGSTLVFSWMQATLNLQDIHYMPSLIIVLVIILFAILTHEIAKWISLHISERTNRYFHINDGQKIVYRIVVVVAQLPVILIYTTGLGGQLQ
ncbi:hypothetical protein [Kaarinaea lacus]